MLRRRQNSFGEGGRGGGGVPPIPPSRNPGIMLIGKDSPIFCFHIILNC